MRDQMFDVSYHA